MNATDGLLLDTAAISIVNSSAFSVDDGWMNVLFGPMASKFAKSFMRMTSPRKLLAGDLR